MRCHRPWIHTSTLWLVCVVAIAWSLSLGQEPAGSQPSDAGSGVLLTGRVSDPQDQPIPMARVIVSARVMGESLSSALTATASTAADSNGRFTIRLPFAGIRYNLLIERPGYQHKYLDIMGGADRSLTIHLARSESTKVIVGSVVDGQGQPVAEARVRAVGEYGWSAETTTNPQGRFRFEDAPDQRQVVFYAQAGGMISPLHQTVRDRGELILRLGPPAVIRGQVTEFDSEKGLPGITVHIRVPYMNDFRMLATSASDGTFVMPEVPPGEYVIEAITETTHFDRPSRGSYSERPKFTAVAGETVNRLVEMLECARIRGRVTDRDGRPVPDALVGTRCSWMGNYEHEQNRLVKTDRDGRFELATGHLNEQLSVRAFSARDGLSYVRVPELREGELRDEVNLRLPGAIHIRGRVVDSEGKPIPDVACEGVGIGTAFDRTDAAGRFDLGYIPIYAGQYLICHAPRPYTGGPLLPRYYLHKKVVHSLSPGDLDLTITLEPTEWLTISGTVTDEKGVLRPGVGVRLFDGAASNYDDPSQDTPDGWQSHSHGGVDLDFPLAVARTDERGVFVFKVLRETPESLRIAIGGVVDGKSFKIVIDREVRKGVERAAQVIDKVVVPPGKAELHVDARLRPQAPDPQPRGPWASSGPATSPAAQPNTDILIYP